MKKSENLHYNVNNYLLFMESKQQKSAANEGGSKKMNNIKFFSPKLRTYLIITFGVLILNIGCESTDQSNKSSNEKERTINKSEALSSHSKPSAEKSEANLSNIKSSTNKILTLKSTNFKQSILLLRNFLEKNGIHASINYNKSTLEIESKFNNISVPAELTLDLTDGMLDRIMFEISFPIQPKYKDTDELRNLLLELNKESKFGKFFIQDLEIVRLFKVTQICYRSYLTFVDNIEFNEFEKFTNLSIRSIIQRDYLSNEMDRYFKEILMKFMIPTESETASN